MNVINVIRLPRGFSLEVDNPALYIEEHLLIDWLKQYNLHSYEMFVRYVHSTAARLNSYKELRISDTDILKALFLYYTQQFINYLVT